MVQYALRIGLAGGAFFFLQVYSIFKGKQSYEKFLNEQANPNQGLLTMVDVRESAVLLRFSRAWQYR